MAAYFICIKKKKCYNIIVFFFKIYLLKHTSVYTMHVYFIIIYCLVEYSFAVPTYCLNLTKIIKA